MSTTETKPNAKARLKALANSDPVMTFDPLLSAVEPKGDYAFYRGGYKLWPNPRAAEGAAIRVLAMGNSTSLWPGHNWSMQVADALRTLGHDVGLFHGAGKGSTSSQEVLRVLRDVPGIKPSIIVSLSGICDIGYLLNSMNYPYAHKYVRRMLDYISEYGFSRDVVYGYPDPSSPAQVWCRNQRMARCLAEAQGARHVVFLQPVMGYGTYAMSDEETAIYESKAPVILQAINKPYGDCVVEFYDEVRAIIAEDPAAHDHILDFVDIFADCPGAYRDHRHQSELGVAHIARAMVPHVLTGLGLSPADGA